MPGRLDFRRTAASGFAPMVRKMAAILACVPIALSAAPSALPLATDIAAETAKMRDARMPMLVLYSQASCTYCDTARTYLVPMSGPEAQGGRALFRQIDIDSDAALVDFPGTLSTHRAVARSHKARVTPTVRIFDADGRAVGEDIVGLRLEDFYATYIENAIDEGRRHMGATD